MGFGYALGSGSGHGVVTLGASPALRRGVAHAGVEPALFFQAIERCIESPRGDLPAGALGDFGANADAVSAIAKPNDREQDDLFELARDHYDVALISDSCQDPKPVSSPVGLIHKRATRPVRDEPFHELASTATGTRGSTGMFASIASWWESA